MTHPYSYVTGGGVGNTRIIVAEEGTLEELAAEHKHPLELPVTSIEYHNKTKREQGDYKKGLPYFVGGPVAKRRHDDNVLARTMLTLDVEQGKNDETPPPSPQTVAERLAELGGAGWIYTSISHTPKSPRYRVVLPLGKPITGESMGTALEASTRAAADKLGISEWTKPESWVLSQPMFVPCKLKGGTHYQKLLGGNHWRVVRRGIKDISDRVGGVKTVSDIPDERPDEILLAIKSAGLYLKENPKHKGMHFIVCPFMDEHGNENESQTVYYEAHHDGNPRPAVKCFDTEPDVNGKPHLTIATLCRYLRKQGHLSDHEVEKAGVLDDDAEFLTKATLGSMLETPPVAREWAVEGFAPVGKVTVLAGPGGVSKSMLALHVLMYAALGRQWGPFKPSGPLRSLYVSYEDDKPEMHKRVFNLVEALRELDDGVFDALYDIKGSVMNNLLMYAADDDAVSWLLLTKPERFGAPERSARVDWLVGFLERNKVRILVLDPAVYTHQLEENNIADMAMYMQTLSYIAKNANCAIVVLHHMNKAASWLTLDDVNQGSLRGASSFADNSRSVGVVVSMPIKDAANYGLPAETATSSQYAVFKHTKHNYSASLGTHIFERKGPLLMPRPDITKLDAVQITEARARQVEQTEEFRSLSSATAVLRCLREASDFVTMGQLSLGSHVHKRRLRVLLEDYAERDWVECEAGPRASVQIRITQKGANWLLENAPEIRK